jgi:hypothetical protein
MTRLARSKIIVLAAGLWPLGCERSHSPTVDVLGSYFPAWIICIVAGLLLTVTARQVFIGLKLDGYLRPAPLIYLCFMICFTLAIWLAFFKN